ncbi:MAG: hypothetical protein CL676_08595 [Bdellovibrionaceae bacterium]|nr:hypothetical protein [Pseudobdellovibrionaceae bacterium]
MKQLHLLPKPNLESGGSLLNTRHQKRTLCSKRPLHLVLKSNKNTLFGNRNFIQKTLKKQSKTFNHQILSWSVQRNHIHILIRICDRSSYLKFIRAFTGLLARKLGRGLWKFRPFTKVLSWGREIENVSSYIFQNEMEVCGIWDYKPRSRNRLREVKY